MNLQELLGEAYNENMSIEDINNALQGKNLADLSTGNYVDINKYNREIQDLQAKLSKKESEIQTVNNNATNESSENQALIQTLQEQLKALEKENNKSNAVASMSEFKTLLEIKDTDSEYNSFLDNVSSLDKEMARNISSYFGKQIKSAYEKGKQDGLKNGLGEMGKQKGSSSTGGKSENFGKELAQKMNANNPTFDYFKRN
jgi:predicted  nucleic acid-binding Zn-ribbon protein